MSDKARIIRAAQRYGPALDRVASRYGISGTALLVKLAQGESGFNQGAVSSAGARGATQFMPGTRASFVQKYGVDPYKSPEEAVHAASIYLRKSGLAAYNPGDPNYSRYILGQKVGAVGGGPRNSSQTLVTRTSTTAPQLHTDKLAALRDALLSGSKNPLISAARGVASGRYDTMTPGSKTVTQDLGNPSGIVTGNGPTGGKGKVIGHPYVGTHTLGNWQSDNAIDIAVPRGSPVYADRSGRISKVSIRPEGGQISGSSITINGASFYTHLSGVKVRPGQRVRRGQLIGYSGVANGVPHLHYAVRVGTPHR